MACERIWLKCKSFLFVLVFCFLKFGFLLFVRSVVEGFAEECKRSFRWWLRCQWCCWWGMFFFFGWWSTNVAVRGCSLWDAASCVCRFFCFFQCITKLTSSDCPSHCVCWKKCFLNGTKLVEVTNKNDRYATKRQIVVHNLLQKEV